MLNKKVIFSLTVFVICILTIFIVVNNIILNDNNVYSNKGTEINSKINEPGSVLEKKQREMSENDFGADMPVLGFAGYNNIVIYDDYGIYIFNLSDDKLYGYFDFEENGLGGLQGSNATFVYVSSDGSSIYISGKKKKFIYEIEKGTYKMADFDKAELDLWKQKKVAKPVETDIYYSIGEVYKDKEKHKMFLAIRKDLQPNYASLVYVQSDGMEDDIHYLFK